MFAERPSAPAVRPPALQATDSTGAIQLRLRSLAQLFNSMDPSPFHERDLDPTAEEWIVSSAKEAPDASRLRLALHLEDTVPDPADDPMVERAVHAFFQREAELEERRFRQLMRRGRKSLLIGLSVVALAVLLGDLIHTAMGGGRMADVVRESFLIGGWVAMWRPLEIFLYDWWPIRGQRNLYLRLAQMKVEVKRCGLRCEHDLIPA
ncbi:MAG TPA: hypothetical protein VMZ25_04120 [Terriglobales bacterium]|nr:hypothetical protein [Terriglobales bacterium]